MQDLRLALRSLLATPVVTVIAILSLALGIGANTAIFSLIDSLVLRTLPVTAPDELVTVSTPRLVGLRQTAGWPYAVWDRLRNEPGLFAEVAAWSGQRFNLSEKAETRFVRGVYVSGSFFRVLGVPALVGRTITEADDRRGGGPDGAIAMLSYGFSQREFGGSLNAIGQHITIERVPFTVVGVTPSYFFGADVGRAFDVMVPIADEAFVRGRQSWIDQKSFYWLSLLGRLRPGLTIDGANALLQSATPAIREATIPENFPARFRNRYLNGPEGFTIIPSGKGASSLRQRYQRPLVTILVVVGLVLLVACANIANLLLARASARRQEIAVRRALGSSSWRLARPHLIESSVLAIVGGAFGLVFASWSSRVILQQLSTRTSTVFLDVSLNPAIIAFTIGVMAATVLLFGTLPALRAAAVDPMDALKEHGRAGVGRQSLTSNGLIVVQVMLSIVLVVAAGLLLRTFTALGSRPLGFDADRTLVVNIDAQRVPADTVPRLLLYDRVRAAAGQVPGVAGAAYSLVTPMQGGGISDQVEVSGGAKLPPALLGGIANVYGNMVSTGWFTALGVRVIAGRDFTADDRTGAPRAAIVNEAFVRTFLGGADPIGRTLKHLRGVQAQIVGVVADSVYGSLREPAPPTFYEPLPQADLPPISLSNVSLTVRAGDRPAAIARSVTAAIEQVSSDVALTVFPLSDQVNAALAQERVTALLASTFGAVALALAGLGVYGVTAYAVARRRAELGIRLALGATPAAVVRLVLSHVALIVAIGVIAGAAASAWAARFIASLLYGLPPRDPATFIGAVATLAAVSTVAAFMPAWRASRIEPAEVLREN